MAFGCRDDQSKSYAIQETSQLRNSANGKQKKKWQSTKSKETKNKGV